MSYDGSQEEPHGSPALLPSVPPMPSVPTAELYRGRPTLLLDSGLSHSLGWQDDRKAGPSFVVVRLMRLDRVTVTERFPLTEQGWAAAWRAFAALDASAAAAVEAKLAKQEVARRSDAALTALNSETLCRLRSATFNGGSGEVPLSKGAAYDVRFMGDRVMVCLPSSVNAIVELPYRDVEATEVSGSSPDKSSGQLVALTVTLGVVVGAVLGLLVFGAVGLLLGALVFGLVGALAGATSSKVEATVRIRGRDAELYFVLTGKPPDALRIELSDPLRLIDNARAARAGELGALSDPAGGPIPDQLTKLASLLQQSLITRDEFDHLKAKVIAES